MKNSFARNLVSIVLVLSLTILSAVPAFAGTHFNIYKANVGKGTNPLTIPYDGNTLNYVSLGDSIAYGYGMGEGEYKLAFSDIFAGGATKRYAFEVEGCYANLIKNYFKDVTSNKTEYKQRAICSARVDDFLTLIDTQKYPGDDFYNKILRTLMLRGIYNEDKYDKTKYTVPTDEQLNEDFGTAVTNADFITLTAGGNNLFAFLVLTEDMLSKYGISVGAVNADLSKYYGTAIMNSFNIIKNSTLAQAKLLDSVASKAEGEKSYEVQAQEVFVTIEKLLYTLAAYSTSAPKLLDLIHSKNPSAVIAVTGMPYAFADFDVKIGSITVDLEKIVKPMFGFLNNVFKDAAQSRSTYCRYVDISDVELIEPSEEWQDRIVEASELTQFFSANLDATHPSSVGHKQIADRIMSNFQVVIPNSSSLGINLDGIMNSITNLWNSFLSRIGITKIGNFLSVIKSIKLSGLLKFSWS